MDSIAMEGPPITQNEITMPKTPPHLSGGLLDELFPNEESEESDHDPQLVVNLENDLYLSESENDNESR